ncbi:MAG: hypothetical protein JWM86_2379, partial [Thermoleophilia bacterium]|nr:hypothetical protein [Thermoleophilia bacterium]
PQAPAPQWHQAQPHPQHQHGHHAAPQYQTQPAPVQHVTYATAVAPAQPASPAAPVHRTVPAPSPFANATRPAQVTWDGGGPAADKTLLQRVSPVHMGVLLIMVIVAMVVTSGPAAMTAKPGRLPALASGGGVGVDGMPVRAGSTALAATTPSTAPSTAAAATPAARTATATRDARPRVAGAAPRRIRGGARMIAVGSSRVSSAIRSGGIPSPAASANLAIAGGGRVVAGSTGDVQMNGIPSPAASEKLGPQQLPFRATDGVTLPRGASERDSHAVDTHYGDDTLAMEEPVELPAMTPGAAAARAETRVIRNDMAGTAPAPNTSGGLIVAM